MKKYFILSFSLLLCLSALAQNKIDEHINKAKTQYNSGTKKAEARFEIYQALEELDVIIGEEILKQLPAEMAGLKFDPKEDSHIGSSAGFTGLYVHRIYKDPKDENKKVEISIVNDSPFFAMVNTFVNTPMAGLVPGRKSVKVDGYKGMLQKDDQSDPVIQTYYIPFGQSLITVIFSKFSSENETMTEVNKIKVSEIVEIAK